MKILKSITLKITYGLIVATLAFVLNSLLEQVRGITGYQDSIDAGALGNRVQRLLEVMINDRMLWVWYAVIVLASLLLGYMLTKGIYTLKLYVHSWYLAFLHFFLYGIVFVVYGDFSVKYTDYGFEGINLHAWNQFIILVLEMLAVFLCLWIQENKDLLGNYLKGRSMVFTCILCAYAAFACVGNYLFMSSSNNPWSFSFSKLLVFFFFAAWISPFLLAILLLLEKNRLSEKTERTLQDSSKGKRRLLLAVFGQAIVIFTLYLIACNPGNMYTDAMIVLKEITTLPFSKLGFAFPIAISSFYKLVFMVFPQPIIITIIQVLIAAILEVCVAGFFYKRGIFPKVILAAAMVFSAIPANGLFVVTFTSNFYYTVACIFLTLVFSEASEEGDLFWRTPLKLAKMLFALILVAITRNEGLIAATFIAFVILVKLTLVYKRKIIPLYVVIAMSFGALWVSGIFSWLLEKSLNAYSTVGVDNVNAVAYYGGDLPKKTLFPEIIKEEYTLYEVGNLSAYSYNNNYPDLVLKTVLHNPLIILRNRLNKSDCMWDVLENEGVHTAREIIGVYENDMGVVRQNNILTTVLVYLLYPMTVAFCVTDVLLYRSGIYMILSFVLCLYWISNKMQRRMILVPAWSHAFVLFLSLLWQCSRHTYPIMLCTCIAFLHTLTVDHFKRQGADKVETI